MPKHNPARSQNPREHKSWVTLIRRCYEPNHCKYAAYHGRGITVCDRWRYGENGLTGFECFLIDMGPRPENTSIDRIDNDGNYEPDNCRWATPKQQANNRRPYPIGKSGKRGVSRISATLWQARLIRDGKQINLGCHPTPEAASEAYERARAEYDATH